MKTYRVRVETTHLEDYFVEAESSDEAREIWSEFPMDTSQCIEVCGVESVEEVDD